MMADAPVGWARPSQSRKYHYFKANGRSLCGNWASLFMPAEMFSPDNGVAQKDDCAGCRKKLDKVPAQPPPATDAGDE